jgi:hypothetical protein
MIHSVRINPGASHVYTLLETVPAVVREGRIELLGPVPLLARRLPWSTFRRGDHVGSRPISYFDFV